MAVFVSQFRRPLIFILLAALAVTVLLGEHLDASLITAVLAVNAVIGFTQERKPEGAVRALMQFVVPHARVVRDGQEREIDSRQLVAGDVVLLESIQSVAVPRSRGSHPPSCSHSLNSVQLPSNRYSTDSTVRNWSTVASSSASRRAEPALALAFGMTGRRSSKSTTA